MAAARLGAGLRSASRSGKKPNSTYISKGSINCSPRDPITWAGNSDSKSAPRASASATAAASAPGRKVVSASRNSHQSPEAASASWWHACGLPAQLSGRGRPARTVRRGSPAPAARAASAVPSSDRSSSTKSRTSTPDCASTDSTQRPMRGASSRAGTSTLTRGAGRLASAGLGARKRARLSATSAVWAQAAPARSHQSPLMRRRAPRGGGATRARRGGNGARGGGRSGSR
ncbi:hypothetical protein D3C72_946990 [compost metagenome]